MAGYAGHAWLAMAGHCWPWLAMAGQGRPWSVHGRPLPAMANHGRFVPVGLYVLNPAPA